MDENIATLLETFVRNMLSNVNTCVPGKIVSYENGRASVSPTVEKIFDDGDKLSFPVIPDARVIWPSFAGGKAGLKGPVRSGDNCLIIFSQQAIDGSTDPRMFDLQDAYALMCDLGNVGGEASNNDDLVLYHGQSKIVLKENGEIQLIGKASIILKDNAEISINAPSGLTSETGEESSGAVFKGRFVQSGGDMISNGIVVHTHVHDGVESGPSKTGGPTN